MVKFLQFLEAVALLPFGLCWALCDFMFCDFECMCDCLCVRVVYMFSQEIFPCYTAKLPSIIS
jgi:hypothetical protein